MKTMNFSINERIAILMAIKARKKELMEMARDKIEYRKSLELDITENRDISYLVSEINLCTRLMAKIWNY